MSTVAFAQFVSGTAWWSTVSSTAPRPSVIPPPLEAASIHSFQFETRGADGTDGYHCTEERTLWIKEGGDRAACSQFSPPPGMAHTIHGLWVGLSNIMAFVTCSFWCIL